MGDEVPNRNVYFSHQLQLENLIPLNTVLKTIDLICAGSPRIDLIYSFSIDIDSYCHNSRDFCEKK